jgi:integrase
MPVVINRQDWETTFRSQVRKLASGWNVVEFRDRIRLKVRPAGQPEQSVLLPFRWDSDSTGDAYVRIRNLYKLVAEGHSLRSAAEIAEGRAPKAAMDWAAAVERFKVQKMEHGRAIKPITWDRSYGPALAAAVPLLTGRKPVSSPADLMDAVIRLWPPGSKERQVRAQALAQFLRYCVTREQFPALWMPPTDLSSHVGAKGTHSGAIKKGDPLADQQIINLITSLPLDGPGCRWGDALRLMAELGLRPIELLHLTVRIDPGTGRPYWWCTYQKRSGGGDTQPRRVHPLPLVDGDGIPQRWNLIERWQAGLIELPPLSSGNGSGDCVATYLNRQPGWRSLRSVMAAKGERAVPYSFRHSYSLRGHLRGIDGGSVALSMGHSFEVHCRSYPWASAAGAAAAFERANAALMVV